jgi:hypothetical protein
MAKKTTTSKSTAKPTKITQRAATPKSSDSAKMKKIMQEEQPGQDLLEQ